MPFGEELDADETYRKTLQKYGQTDSVRQKFTGYQNDTETGLDFAEARMYQNLHGRFTAVDPLLASGKSGNPQTFNRYVYVMNSPLILSDPNGLQAGSSYSGPPFSFRMYVNAFAPFQNFGPFGMAFGDGANRKFGADPTASYRIQAQSKVSVGTGGYYPWSQTRAALPSTSTTMFPSFGLAPLPIVPVSDKSEGYMRDPDTGNLGTLSREGSLRFHVFGNDDAFPPFGSLSPTPDIDIRGDFSFVPSDRPDGSVAMRVSGFVNGDQFPAMEAFLIGMV